MIDPPSDEEALSAALRSLPRELEPPPEIVQALLSSRRRERAQRLAWLWRSAFAASLMVVAFIAGRASYSGAPAGVEPGHDYVFLLYGGESGDGVAAEYGRWARSIAATGTRVSGERLADRAITVGSPRLADALLRGYFVVRAPSEESALSIAARHPHSARGTIEVRQIDTPGR